MPLGAFNPHSPETRIIASLFANLLILLVVIFLIVAALVAWGVIRYRARGREGEPLQTFGSRRLEIAWTAFPLAIVTVLFIVTVSAMVRIDAPDEPDRAPDLVVTGHQWWWEARYPNGAVAVTEFHIPAGRRLLVQSRIRGCDPRFLGAAAGAQDGCGAGRPGYIWLEARARNLSRAAARSSAVRSMPGCISTWSRNPKPNIRLWLQHQAEPASLAPDSRCTRRRCAECHSDPR